MLSHIINSVKNVFFNRNPENFIDDRLSILKMEVETLKNQLKNDVKFCEEAVNNLFDDALYLAAKYNLQNFALLILKNKIFLNEEKNVRNDILLEAIRYARNCGNEELVKIFLEQII